MKFIAWLFNEDRLSIPAEHLPSVLNYQQRISRSRLEVDSAVSPAAEMMFVASAERDRGRYLGFGSFVVRDPWRSDES